jgi:hypothetical protein
MRKQGFNNGHTIFFVLCGFLFSVMGKLCCWFLGQHGVQGTATSHLKYVLALYEQPKRKLFTRMHHPPSSFVNPIAQSVLSLPALVQALRVPLVRSLA